MTRKRITIIIAAIALLIAGTVTYATFAVKPHTAQNNRLITQPTAPQPTKYEVGPPDAQELLELVNAERAIVGVAPLVIDERLNQSAQWKADDMVTNNYFAHVKPGENGMDGVQKGYDLTRIADGKSECSEVSENIYWGREHNTSQGALNWWMNSKPHHDAILNSEYTLTGFGIAGNKVVEHFCITR